MGLVQDLLYHIKTPKLKLRLRFLRYVLCYVKYVIFLLFVIILPMTIRHDLPGLGHPWFCAYICPSDTLFGAVPLLAAVVFPKFKKTVIIIFDFGKLILILGQSELRQASPLRYMYAFTIKWHKNKLLHPFSIYYK